MKTGKKYIPSRNRADLAAKEREREERGKKLEELKQHALQAQRFREQQDHERRRHIEQLRMKDMDRRQQVEERRKEIEKSELERKEAIIAKNKERDLRLVNQRKNSRSNMEFAFGSSAPRMMEPRVDSGSGYWGTRSVSGQTMFERSSTSQERDATDNLRSKRTTSAQGLNVTTEGISRENSSASRPGSALSSGRAVSGVRMRSTPTRRPRPLSIATTGMTTSMYEERQKPAHFVRDKSLNTPKAERMKRARSVTSDNVGDNEDTRSVSSSQSVGSRTPARKTPSQVKAESAARKAKTSSASKTSTPKSSLGNVSNGTKEGKTESKSPSPALSQDNVSVGESKGRQSTPDIIKDNNRKTLLENGEVEKEKSPAESDNAEAGEPKEGRKMITSEEEAKARIAEKRREMKEQKEREAELERLRLEEEARLEAERLRQEEEEEKRIIALEQEARKAEEERIRKAIEEKEAEDRRKKEEEEKSRAEKEEQEKKMKAEAEKREAELQEKLQKEEEERLARKKRIEEIMARTRGAKAAGAGAGGTPKKDPAETNTDTNPSQTSPAQQPASLDTNVDPTKPDLLGDITDQVEEENAKNP